MAAATGDDLDARMTAAYASGDMDAIMALLGISDACPAHATESPSVDDSGPARLDAHAEEFVPGGGGSATEEFAMSGDPGMGGVEGLIARFPRTQPELVEAVLDSCGGDVAEATRMLGEMEQEAEFYEQVDTHAYVEAVKHFDEQFPSLGGPGGGQSVQLGSDKQQTPYDSSLLLKMRKDTLLAQFPWVDPSVVDVELTAAAGSSHAAGQRLEALYPKPEGWDALEKKKVEDMRLARQRAARANAGIGENVAPARSSDAVRKTRDMGGHWVATGESVRLLYESLRAEAADEASVRNTYFDGAAAAIRRGDGLAAKRLGALGREANERMKALHHRAADAIFEARNPPGVHGQIDLHGLHVAEAIERLPVALESTTASRVRVLTGSGHHTKGTGRARLRPAVRSWLERHGYVFEEVQDSNAHVGAFVVHASGAL